MVSLLLSLVVLAVLDSTASLEEPFLVQAGDRPIQVEIGHAAPLPVDYDGDGRRDLLVGQFGDGKLRIYRNQGSDESPAFGSFEYFRAGAKEATVPFG
ncbi:MAG: VCBS repeat-containing protein [Armatimonadetes bacterium]|nr:VCBS repeat-containing protein [Armatimonadota bacterium]